MNEEELNSAIYEADLDLVLALHLVDMAREEVEALSVLELALGYTGEL